MLLQRLSVLVRVLGSLVVLGLGLDGGEAHKDVVLMRRTAGDSLRVRAHRGDGFLAGWLLLRLFGVKGPLVGEGGARE